MQITKELLDNDIAQTEQQLAALTASLASVNGALSVLKNMRDYVMKMEPEAVPLQDIAEAVAGPGAEVVDINPIAPDMVVNGNGKYVEKK